MDLNMCPCVLFMYSFRTGGLKVATERDLTEKYSVWVPKKMSPYGGVPGVAAGALFQIIITAWANAAVLRLFIQLLID